MSQASSKFSSRPRHKRGAGQLVRYKGNRRFYQPCKVKGCLLGVDHRGAHYMGED